MDTQDAPIEDGHDEATIPRRSRASPSRCAATPQLGHVDDLRAMARQRLEEAQLPTDEATVDRVVGVIRPS